MRQEDKYALAKAIEIDGLDYALVHYSNWEEINSELFQNLYKKFIEARSNLIDYLSSELDNNELDS